MIVIGITGTLAAGKGAVVDYLIKKRGFTHYSMRAFLTEEITRRGLPVNRDMMKMVADEFRQTRHPGFLVEHFLAEAKKHNHDAIIESIRSVGEVQTLKHEPNTYLLSVDADVKLRYERSQIRKSATDSVSFEKFVADEQRESISDEPWAMNLPKCKALANFQATNNGSLEELYAQIDLFLKKIVV